MPNEPLPFMYDDGGRRLTGRRGDAGDCVTRAIAIAGRLDYDDVYRDLADRMAALGKARSAREGVSSRAYKPWFAERGWIWTPTMTIGSGCLIHLAVGELPVGRLVARLSRHLTAVVDGVVRDTFDPGREGTRCVYGYWMAP